MAKQDFQQPLFQSLVSIRNHFNMLIWYSKLFTGRLYIIQMLRWALFVTYAIIQSITSSEMCSLHLTHPSTHTLGAVGRRHCSARGAVGGSGFGALLKSLTSVVDNSCRSRDSNPQPRVTSPTLYPARICALCLSWFVGLIFKSIYRCISTT